MKKVFIISSYDLCSEDDTFKNTIENLCQYCVQKSFFWKNLEICKKMSYFCFQILYIAWLWKNFVFAILLKLTKMMKNYLNWHFLQEKLLKNSKVSLKIHKKFKPKKNRHKGGQRSLVKFGGKFESELILQTIFKC